MGAVALDLSPGAGVVLDEVEWLVERQEPHLGRIQLVRGDGERQRVSFRFLVNHPQCRPSPRTAAEGANRGRQPASWSDVKPEKRPLMEQRFAHLMEVNCGFRSGDPFRPEPGEPRPEYDPDRTTLGERRAAKVAELAVLRPEEAKLLLGVATVGCARWSGGRSAAGSTGSWAAPITGGCGRAGDTRASARRFARRSSRSGRRRSDTGPG